jgi:2'-5' RNA ligase
MTDTQYIRREVFKILLESEHGILDIGMAVENISEGHHKKNEYGCLMIDLEADAGDWKKMLDLIDGKDLYLPKGETGYGKEPEPHVTVLYGFHTDVEDKDIEKKVQSIGTKPKVSIGSVSSFTNKDFDVLKFDVESEDLHRLNKKFKSFPHTSGFPDYHPHCTIAYLKKGMADKYIKKFNKSDVKIKVEPKDFVYSKADGSKKKYAVV